MTRASMLRRLSGLVILSTAVGCAQASDADREAAVLAVLDGFYGAIRAGDAEAAMEFIAPDAMFVESGTLETREQYEQNHLPSDIDFESKFTGEREREVLRMGADGDVVWILARTHYDGTFDDFPLEFDSFQMAALSRESGEWLIESVHWSSV